MGHAHATSEPRYVSAHTSHEIARPRSPYLNPHTAANQVLGGSINSQRCLVLWRRGQTPQHNATWMVNHEAELSTSTHAAIKFEFTSCLLLAGGSSHKLNRCSLGSSPAAGIWADGRGAYGARRRAAPVFVISLGFRTGRAESRC